jgi:hypothetical protein
MYVFETINKDSGHMNTRADASINGCSFTKINYEEEEKWIFQKTLKTDVLSSANF